MGRGRDITVAESSEIVRLSSNGCSIREIAKRMGRDWRTISKHMKDVHAPRKVRSDKGKCKISSRSLAKVTRECRKNPFQTSKTIFDNSGLPEVPKTTRCRILKSSFVFKNATCRPPLSEINKSKRIKWAKKYLKTDFSTVLFTDECRVSKDGPDSFGRGWSFPGVQKFRWRRQQGGGGVMFWAGILNDKLIGPFRVPDGVKLDSKGYCDFLRTNLLPVLEDLPITVWNNFIFQQDNAPSHASKYTKAFLDNNSISGDRIMEWPPSSPDLNCIENLWAILKLELYRDGKQYTSNNDLWNSIDRVCRNISPETVKNLTKSMDNRLIEVIRNNGGYIKR